MPLALAASDNGEILDDDYEPPEYDEMVLIAHSFRAFTGSEDATAVALEYKDEISSEDAGTAAKSNVAVHTLVAESLQRRPFTIHAAASSGLETSPEERYPNTPVTH